MIPCIHDYIGHGSRVACRLCDKPSPCEKRTNRDMYGFHPHAVKTHYFFKGVCTKCGMYQFKTGKYKSMEIST